MIKIHKQLWYVTKPTKDDPNLAYMTYYEDNEAFNKRKATGEHWASGQRWDYTLKKYIKSHEPDGVVIDNAPVKGLYIGDSVSRWTTSNKLFRVLDPRGFTVEVPTGNISTLLHLCTVVNGVVQEECVWGREGSNHIILPINSEPYLETLEKMDILQNKLIAVKDLKIGDHFKLFENDRTYYYAGKVKATWEVTRWVYKGWGYHGERSNRDKIYSPTETHAEVGYRHVYLYKDKDTWFEGSIGSKPKITEVVKNSVIKDLDSKIHLYHNLKSEVVRRYSHADIKMIKLEWKNG
jgi:hypothetical protein